jgi:hypothetical protein
MLHLGGVLGTISWHGMAFTGYQKGFYLHSDGRRNQIQMLGY